MKIIIEFPEGCKKRITEKGVEVIYFNKKIQPYFEVKTQMNNKMTDDKRIRISKNKKIII